MHICVEIRNLKLKISRSSLDLLIFTLLFTLLLESTLTVKVLSMEMLYIDGLGFLLSNKITTSV